MDGFKAHNGHHFRGTDHLAFFTKYSLNFFDVPMHKQSLLLKILEVSDSIQGLELVSTKIVPCGVILEAHLPPSCDRYRFIKKIKEVTHKELRESFSVFKSRTPSVWNRVLFTSHTPFTEEEIQSMIEFNK